jgi:predicted transcriptional regulator
LQNYGSNKIYEFGVNENPLAKYAKALAHPARIAILQFLAKQQSCMCGDIVDELLQSQSTVSQSFINPFNAIIYKMQGARFLRNKKLFNPVKCAWA